MITNERQYLITKTELVRFQSALAAAATQHKKLHPLLRKAARDRLQSQADELREEIAAYEKLREGKETRFEFDSIAQLAEGLIKARIARHLTQRELAESLNLKEQQIQRYEATMYESAPLKRIEAVAVALSVRKTVTMDVSMPMARAKG